jgi:hypothetical protein
MRPLLFPDDQQFWYETLRALGHTAYGGADIGEVVTTAARISVGDYDSWPIGPTVRAGCYGRMFADHGARPSAKGRPGPAPSRPIPS